VGHWPDEFSSDDPSRDEWERRPDNRRDEAEYRFALAYLASYATWVADGSNVNDRVLDYRQWWDYPARAIVVPRVCARRRGACGVLSALLPRGAECRGAGPGSLSRLRSEPPRPRLPLSGSLGHPSPLPSGSSLTSSWTLPTRDDWARVWPA